MILTSRSDPVHEESDRGTAWDDRQSPSSRLFPRGTMMSDAVTTVRAVCPHDCPTPAAWWSACATARRTAPLGRPPTTPSRAASCARRSPATLDRVLPRPAVAIPAAPRRAEGAGRPLRARLLGRGRRRNRGAALPGIAASPDGPQAILPYSYAGTMGELQGGSLDRRFFPPPRGVAARPHDLRHGGGSRLRHHPWHAGGAGPGGDPAQPLRHQLGVRTPASRTATCGSRWSRPASAAPRIVTIDPYRSPTAAKSDWWLPIRPGTDAALALGVMHVIFREGWQDQDYLDRYCVGGVCSATGFFRTTAPKPWPVSRG